MADAKKILIVEDFDDSRQLMAHYLRRWGYAVSEAADGLEALNQTAAVHPDLILMDISMPRMDGLEATARLKADPATRHIPVVIVTAHCQQSRIDSALDAGARDVFIKPLDFAKLGETLGRYLSSECQKNLPMGCDVKNDETTDSKSLDPSATGSFTSHP